NPPKLPETLAEWLNRGVPPKAEQSLETSQAGWTAPNEPLPRPWWHGFVPLVVVGGLALAAWHGSGAYFEKEAKQRTADRWDQLRVCLLGDALLPGNKPSERVRLIR